MVSLLLKSGQPGPPHGETPGINTTKLGQLGDSAWLSMTPAGESQMLTHPLCSINFTHLDFFFHRICDSVSSQSYAMGILSSYIYIYRATHWRKILHQRRVQRSGTKKSWGIMVRYCCSSSAFSWMKHTWTLDGTLKLELIQLFFLEIEDPQNHGFHY